MLIILKRKRTMAWLQTREMLKTRDCEGESKQGKLTWDVGVLRKLGVLQRQPLREQSWRERLEQMGRQSATEWSVPQPLLPPGQPRASFPSDQTGLKWEARTLKTWTTEVLNGTPEHTGQGELPDRTQDCENKRLHSEWYDRSLPLTAPRSLSDRLIILLGRIRIILLHRSRLAPGKNLPVPRFHLMEKLSQAWSSHNDA